MKKSVLALAIAVLISTPVLAAEGKAYVYGDWGSSTFSNTSPLPNPGLFEIGAGYQFHTNVAIEAGYTMFGDSTVDYGSGVSITAASKSFHAAAVGIYPINEVISLLGKVGFSKNSFDVTSTGLGGASTSGSNSGFYYGVGASYAINQQWGARVQYQDFGKFDTTAPEVSATAINLGVTYSF